MTQPTFAPHGMTFSDISYWYVRAMLSFYLQPRIFLRFVKDMGLQNVIKSGLSFIVNTLGHRHSER
jgi:hypothetical protein